NASRSTPARVEKTDMTAPPKFFFARHGIAAHNQQAAALRSRKSRRDWRALEGLDDQIAPSTANAHTAVTLSCRIAPSPFRHPSSPNQSLWNVGRRVTAGADGPVHDEVSTHLRLDLVACENA